MSASDDVIATLSSRVSELSKRVATLETDLDSAQKRIAIYEEYDSTIQDAISGALRAAHSIRERAETTAAQILDQAREERRMLLKEIERLRDERDALQEEIADHRRSGIQAVTPRPLTSDVAATELRAVASEALRGLFQEIVDDIRATPRAAVAEPARPSEPPPTPRAPEPPAMPRAPEPPQAETPSAAMETMEVQPTETPTYEFMSKVKRAGVTEDETPAAPSASEPSASEPAEDVEVVSSAPPPLEVVPAREVEEIAPPRVETSAATNDIQLVLSPIPSFPRLVEVERRIQSLPMVRTLYVRDFRAGTATLAVALRSAMTPEEFAGLLAGLSEPRMRLVSSARNSLELRIDGAASIA